MAGGVGPHAHSASQSCAQRHLSAAVTDGHQGPEQERASPGAQRCRIRLPCRRPGFDPWVKKIPWRREWQHTPLFLSGESHGQRSLVRYSPCVTESEMT